MASRKQRKELEELRRKARTLLNDRNHERALPLLERLCELEPEEPRWPHKLGQSNERLGQAPAAVAAYQVAARRYAELGFAIKAVALGKVILGLEPADRETPDQVAEICSADAPTPAAPEPAPVSEGMVRVETAEVMVIEPNNVVVAEPDEVSEPDGVVISSAGIPISDAMVISDDQMVLTDASDFDPGAGAWTRPGHRPARPAPPTPPQTVSSAPRPVPPGMIPLGESLDAIDLRQLVPRATVQSTSLPGVGSSFEIPLGDIDAAFAALTPADQSPITAEALPPTPLFSSLDKAALRQLIEHVTLSHHEAGDEIIRQGDTGASLFVLVEGQVTVRRAGIEVATLGEGAFFGEVALLTKLERSATVRATEECTVLEIDRQLVAKLIEEHPGVLTVMLRFFRERLVDTLVDTSELFAPFAGPDRLALAERFRLIEAEPDCSLVGAGKEADGLYILLSGHAEARWPGGGARNLESGELFGERSLLESEPSPVTVTTTTKCWLLKLDRQTFREVIMTHPHVLAVLSDRASRAPVPPPAEGTLEQRLPIL